MPHYNIQHPVTKQWRCFSSISGDWICDWMGEEDYKEWLIQQVVEDMKSEFERKGIQTTSWCTYEDAIFHSARTAWKEENCTNCNNRACDDCKIHSDIAYSQEDYLKAYEETGDDFLGIIGDLNP